MKNNTLKKVLLIANCLLASMIVYFSFFSKGMIDHIDNNGEPRYIALETNNGADQNIALVLIGIMFMAIVITQVIWPNVNRIVINILNMLCVVMSLTTFLVLHYLEIFSINLTIVYGDKSFAFFSGCLFICFFLLVYQMRNYLRNENVDE